jgi:trimethylamine monooxygenase
MDERPLLTKIEGRTVHFKDGSSKNFDAIILCTALPVPGR